MGFKVVPGRDLVGKLPFIDPNASYVAERNIPALKAAGLITDEEKDVADRVDRLANGDHFLGLTEVIAAHETKRAKVFLDDEIPIVQRRLPDLLRWPAAPPPETVVRVPAPLAEEVADLSLRPPFDAQTPVAIADLGSRTLKRLAQRIQRAYDADAEPETICLADVELAKQDVDAFTPDERGVAMAHLERVVRGHLLFGSTVDARARVPLPGTLTIPLTPSEAQVQLKLVVETKLQETQVHADVATRTSERSATLEATRTAALHVEVPSGHHAVFIQSHDTLPEDGAPRPPDPVCSAGSHRVTLRPGTMRIALYRTPTTPATPEPNADGTGTTPEPVEIRDVEIPAFQASDRVDLSAVLGFGLFAEDDVTLHRNQTVGVTSQRKRTALFDWATASAPPQGNVPDGEAFTLPKTRVRPGRYEATLPVVGRVAVDVYRQGVIRVSTLDDHGRIQHAVMLSRHTLGSFHPAVPVDASLTGTRASAAADSPEITVHVGPQQQFLCLSDAIRVAEEAPTA
jgi:hypothetical protein